MIRVQDTPTKLVVVGHAADNSASSNIESNQVCACVTALTQTLLVGIRDVAGDAPSYELGFGKFILNKLGLSEKSIDFCRVFMRGCRILEYQYYDYVRIYRADGTEISAKKEEKVSYRSMFPDWRNFVVNRE